MILSIITVRNREAQRIKALVDSLRVQGAETDFLVVDYGSEPEFATAYRTLADLGFFTLLRMETQGWPWNKCHAINAAVRSTTAEWIATIDVDMVFDCNPFPYCLGNDPKKKIQVMQTHWLPPSGDKKKAHFGGMGHPGPFAFQARTSFEQAGGYDERIQYWGIEDWDWPRRLEALGYKMEWLPPSYRFYHVWHPTANDPTRRPRTASFDTAKVYFENQLSPVLSASWGGAVTLDDRPVLPYIDEPTIPVLMIDPSDWINRFSAIQTFLLHHRACRFVWGPRIKKRKLDGWKGFRPFFNAMVSPFGWTIGDQVNENFDYWYATRDVLTQLGVTDWYLSPQLDSLTVYRGEPR